MRTNVKASYPYACQCVIRNADAEHIVPGVIIGRLETGNLLVCHRTAQLPDFVNQSRKYPGDPVMFAEYAEDDVTLGAVDGKKEVSSARTG